MEQVSDTAPPNTPEISNLAVSCSPLEALIQVTSISLQHNGIKRGLNESVRALDRGLVKICILSNACNETQYVNLITMLCQEKGIPLLRVDNGQTLGRLAGLVKVHPDGFTAKILSCSCCVVTEFGKLSDYLSLLLYYIQQNARFDR